MNIWNKPEISRREFFEKCAEAGAKTFVFGGLVVTTANLLLAQDTAAKNDPQAERAKAEGAGAKDYKGPIYGFVVDTTKCIGCGSCVRACRDENNVPDGFCRTWVEQYTFYPNGEVVVNSPNGGADGFNDDLPNRNMPEELGQLPVRGFFVPKLCNHCINTPCIQVCPVGASYMTKEGVVLVDHERVRRLRLLRAGVPLRLAIPQPRDATRPTSAPGATTASPRGMQPACVEVCPGQGPDLRQRQRPEQRDQQDPGDQPRAGPEVRTWERTRGPATSASIRR